MCLSVPVFSGKVMEDRQEERTSDGDPRQNGTKEIGHNSHSTCETPPSMTPSPYLLWASLSTSTTFLGNRTGPDGCRRHSLEVSPGPVHPKPTVDNKLTYNVVGYSIRNEVNSRFIDCGFVKVSRRWSV